VSTRIKRAALVGLLAAGVVAGGAGTSLASGRSTAAAKATPVTVVVTDESGADSPMTMTVTPSSVPAGKVKITLENQGTVIHEMVVLKTKKPFDQLPVGANHRTSEAKSVGEIADVGKGKTKSKTFKLKAGSYVLMCNVAKHYENGMRAAFTVT
jgi:uncharacterized cupredoxin-like copper-binding protein